MLYRYCFPKKLGLDLLFTSRDLKNRIPRRELRIQSYSQVETRQFRSKYVKIEVFFFFFRVLKFQHFHTCWGCPLNRIAKTASPGPDVSVPSLGSMKILQNQKWAELEMSTIRNELWVNEIGFKNSGLTLEFRSLVGIGRSGVMIGRLCLNMGS